MTPIGGRRPQRIARIGAVLAAAWAVLVLVPAATAAPPATGPPCPDLPIGTCSKVEVPLDRTGSVPGTVRLQVAHVPAERRPARGTILFLAGGPGESALAGGESLVSLFRRYAPAYDLLTFDQRGTGRSGGLDCRALLRRGSEASIFSRCGTELGARRAFYRTSDTVEDIEAVRRAAGLGPIALLGVSYGGRVAAEYVRRYPGSVSRMVLDSPSTLAGTDPFFLQRQRALPRVLRSICGSACRTFTRSPMADMRRAARRLERGSFRTYVLTPRGRRLKVRFGLGDLYGLVSLSDLDPVTRARLPGAVAAAARGDGAPLARALTSTLQALGGPAQASSGVSDALFAATTCAEAPLPWSPASAPDPARDRALEARVRQLGPGPFQPFGSRPVLTASFLGQCKRWPATIPGVQAPAQGPAVPTLVINGSEDLRTPAEQGRELAAAYPGGRELTVPGAGHSAIATDPTRCAARAGFGFIAGTAPPATCRRTTRQVPTAGRPPLSLRGVGGRSRKAKTVRAVRLTANDMLTSLLGTASPTFGGLRGGYAAVGLRPARVRLVGYQYVPGVRVSGLLRRKRGRLVGTLTVTGGRAVPGTVRVTRSGDFDARFSERTGPVVATASSKGRPLTVPPRPRRPAVPGPLPDALR